MRVNNTVFGIRNTETQTQRGQITCLITKTGTKGQTVRAPLSSWSTRTQNPGNLDVTKALQNESFRHAKVWRDERILLLPLPRSSGAVEGHDRPHEFDPVYSRTPIRVVRALADILVDPWEGVGQRFYCDNFSFKHFHFSSPIRPVRGLVLENVRLARTQGPSSKTYPMDRF